MDEVLNMNTDDRKKLCIIRNALSRRFTQAEAAKLLGLGLRQVQRICTEVRRRGDRSILHGLCGRRSNNHLDPELLGQALSAMHDDQWKGFGPVFCVDKLKDFYGITISAGTARRLMILTNLWEPHRRGKRHRAWRERRTCVGMLVQLDGSEHDWFEGRGPKCALLVYIDDATSTILYAEFVKVEDTFNLMRSTGLYLRKHGRPVDLYVDKDSIYTVNRQARIDEELRDEDPITQFKRAMTELGVGVILANSPQAKGRVERGFHTHQDRLVKELRLAGISDMAAGNVFLRDIYIDDHNARFAVEPANPTNAHRPLLASHRLDQILSRRTQRTIANDYTVRFQNRFFQLFEDQPVRLRPKDAIEVEIRLDGTTHLRAKDSYLRFKPIPKRPYRPLLRAQPSHGRVYHDPRIKGLGSTPAANHPWRRLFLNGPHRVALAPRVVSTL